MFVLVGLALFVGGEADSSSAEEQNKHITKLITGIIIWQLFADAWLEPMRFGRRTKTVLRVVTLDENSLLLAGAISAMINFLIKLPVIIIALLWFNITPGLSVLIPIGIMSILFAGASLSCFTLPISLLLLDVRYSIPIIQFALLLATPVLYDIPTNNIIANINHYNPITYLILPIRNAFLNASTEESSIIFSSLAAIIFLVIGMYYYRAKIRLSIAYIGR